MTPHHNEELVTELRINSTNKKHEERKKWSKSVRLKRLNLARGVAVVALAALLLLLALGAAFLVVAEIHGRPPTARSP